MLLRPLFATSLVAALFAPISYADEANDTSETKTQKTQQTQAAQAQLIATDMEGGPTIQEGLHWVVRHGATGEIIYEESDVGSVTAEIPAGVHDVEVTRLADEAQAEGEIVLTPRGAKLTLPLITEHEATLDAPETATAGETIRVTWSGPDEKRDFVGVYAPGDNNRKSIYYFYTDNGNPFHLKMPETAGTYEIRYVLGKSNDTLAQQNIELAPVEATLSATEQAPAGSIIEVAWTGPDYKSDYIAVYEPDANNRKSIYYTQTSEGSPVQLKLPESSGTYEIRYVLNSSRQDLAQHTIETTPIEATLETPEQAQAGSKVRVQWTGPDYKSDYIGIFKPDDKNRSPIRYFSTDNGNPFNLSMPDEPGTYEIRYVLNSSRQDLARQPIEVTE